VNRNDLLRFRFRRSKVLVLVPFPVSAPDTNLEPDPDNIALFPRMFFNFFEFRILFYVGYRSQSGSEIIFRSGIHYGSGEENSCISCGSAFKH
jgi:hypothetical protein